MALATETRPPSTYDNRRQMLRDTLAGLGATGEAVAHTLRITGYKGVPCDSGACPVSRFIEAQLGGYCWVLETTAGWEWRGGQRVTVSLPASVAAFVDGFDREAYPELVAPS